MSVPDLDLDQELDRLRAAVEHIGANLVAFEQDPTVALLDLTDLRAESAERWAAARIALADLFGSYTALGAVVERAVALRGRSRWLTATRASELAELLRGRSVLITGQAVALVDRRLLGSSRTATRWTPAALLEQMSASFDEIRGVVTTAALAWDGAVARIQPARRRLTAMSEVVTPSGSSLARLGAELDALAADVLADPLTLDWGRLDRIDADLTAAEAERSAAADLHDDPTTMFDAARALLGEVTADVESAADIVARTRARIVVPTGTATIEPGDDLAADLDRIEELAADERWSDAAAGLAAWRVTAGHRRATAATAATEHEALLLTRGELRGRLGAYAAKADRLGLLEDPDVAERHRRAHDALHTAPTDLGVATELVRRYQESLTAPRPTPPG
ncbi:MAG: hypothetical protein ABWZ99_13880, partial [Ilumatobacteraceae bacterium]